MGHPLRPCFLIRVLSGPSGPIRCQVRCRNRRTGFSNLFRQVFHNKILIYLSNTTKIVIIGGGSRGSRGHFPPEIQQNRIVPNPTMLMPPICPPPPTSAGTMCHVSQIHTKKSNLERGHANFSLRDASRSRSSGTSSSPDPNNGRVGFRCTLNSWTSRTYAV